ncbi:putative glycolipid permease LtaA [Pelotomaculum sp. FP]|nr:putative glycolipid permease LtaA [Pelotomaculum sp. FP]
MTLINGLRQTSSSYGEELLNFLHELKIILSSKRDLGLLMVLFLMEFTRGAFFLTFLPLYAVNYLSISVAAAGLAVSAHYLFETLFKSTAGWELDRRGLWVLHLGLLMGLFALLIIKLHPTTYVLIAGSAFFGLAVSPVWLAVISNVAPVQSSDRAARMGVVFAVWLAGCGGGPVAINFFIVNEYGLAFWLLIGLWILAMLVAAVTLRGPGGITVGGAGFSFNKEIEKLAQNQAVKKILLPGMFLQTLSGGLLLPLLPIYAQTELGLNPNQYAFLLLSAGSAAAISFLPMGRLADRVRLKTLLGTGFAMTALSLALFSAARGMVSVFLLAALLGFSYAIVLPAWNNLLAKVISPDRQATGWGVFATIEGAGIAIGPALGGLVARSFGISAVIMLTIMLLASMACFYFAYPVEKLFARTG